MPEEEKECPDCRKKFSGPTTICSDCRLKREKKLREAEREYLEQEETKRRMREEIERKKQRIRERKEREEEEEKAKAEEEEKSTPSIAAMAGKGKGAAAGAALKKIGSAFKGGGGGGKGGGAPSMLDDPGVANKALLAIILSVLGGFIGLFIPTYGFAGLGLLVLAGYITRDVKNIWPFFGITIGVILMPYVGFLVSFGTILVSVTISLFTFSGSATNPSRIFMYTIGSGFAVAFSYFATGSFQSLALLSLIIIGVLTAGYFMGSTNIPSRGRLIGGFAGFVPLLGLAAWWLFTTGSIMFGNVGDLIQHNLKQGLGVGSGGLFDMILDPKLATQMFMKPPTVREGGETPFMATIPSVSFTVSSQTVPSAGCYGTSFFQIISKVKNTGNVYIEDIDVTVVKEEVIEISNPCNNIYLSEETDTLIKCEYNQRSIPQGSTLSETCMASVPTPSPSYLPDLETGEIVEQPAESHTCFVDITATTGYHSVARLPIEIIESSYARSQFEQGKLQQGVVPTTVGQGPIELSIGGFEQPIWDNTRKVPLIVSLSNTGNGAVGEYSSLYLYIPKELLNSSEPCGKSSSFECREGGVDSLTGFKSPYAASYSDKFTDYRSDSTIGGFTQAGYDNSFESLNSTHYICFYSEELDPEDLITMAVCTLELEESIMDMYTTRKTFIIRGDVLYTYQVTGEATVTVRDCEIV